MFLGHVSVNAKATLNSIRSAQESRNYRKALYRSYVTNSLSKAGHQSRKETPSQKLRRLIIETQELEAQIETMDPEACKNLTKERTPIDIVNQLNAIQQKTAQLRLKLPGSQQVTLSSEGDRLMCKLNGLFVSENLPQIPAALKPPPYQNQVAHALELEARVASLEALLGPETLIKADIPQEQGLAALLASMLKMVERIKEPDHIFSINKRLKELISELDRLTSLRDSLKQLGRDQVLFSESSQVDSETKAKIDGLLGLYDKFEVYMALGPQIVTRLKLLTAMHQELSGFGKSLDKLTAQMNDIRATTQEGKTQYQQLFEQLRSCQDSVNSDLTRLDSQLNTLLAQTQALNG
ncbi:hypothetical protein DSO57_1029068 [Entomophthora muscae]|uniref:Uncharacterized protein n=3 Tax=Entomophthora muscae TaxID=34485 RepID=A0ACC2SQK8_9FUNG|nr:hypothetical protein DSO57_1029068 [Entomophthora muscae]